MDKQEYRWMIATQIEKNGYAYLDFQDKIYQSFNAVENSLTKGAPNLIDKFDKDQFTSFFNSIVVVALDQNTNQSKDVVTVKFSDRFQYFREYLDSLVEENY